MYVYTCNTYASYRRIYAFTCTHINTYTRIGIYADPVYMADSNWHWVGRSAGEISRYLRTIMYCRLLKHIYIYTYIYISIACSCGHPSYRYVYVERERREIFAY